MVAERTHRWRGAVALSLAVIAAGATTRVPAVLVLGVLGVAGAGYATLFAPPAPSLSVERSVSEDAPAAGDEVDVTLTVTNDGSFLPDLRLIDGVPDTLAVADGTPRLATALRAGKSATVTYTVEATRGDHEFDPVAVIARDISGSHETRTTVPAATTLTCVPDLPRLAAFPLRRQPTQRAGPTPTPTGGSGVAFHATREYRSGDPLSRVDWTRLARDGELATVQFRAERAATAVAVVDTRRVAHVSDADGTNAVEYGVEAAGGVASALLDAGNQVGVASLGPHWAWLAPGLGREHRARLEALLARDRGFSVSPPDRRFLSALVFRRLRTHLPDDAQVVFCSPLVDDTAAEYVRRLEASGHPVTVVSPDVTGAETLGQRFAGVARAVRVRSLRAASVRVIDWQAGDSLAVAVADAERGWFA
ncbi:MULTISPECIES: DUF58 domain-containing protein [Halobacterium]|uniref:DUF58 domain-containing protein n=1 Tax=Halobacterium TaxID=2239 RepID=UPI0019637096|nr:MULTISPECIES: DUF58 domain-containing protein [Halobacterium]MCF2166780.1 DUF58 domain-containing protein [Halobacterium salinarum]QRY22879.1 DUF58 domain-containing protein [Halobacterium sp. GSL-19]WJK64176.1 DUF58 domain-containing protein [Halobacterium salinarum]